MDKPNCVDRVPQIPPFVLTSPCDGCPPSPAAAGTPTLVAFHAPSSARGNYNNNNDDDDDDDDDFDDDDDDECYYYYCYYYDHYYYYHHHCY